LARRGWSYLDGGGGFCFDGLGGGFYLGCSGCSSCLGIGVDFEELCSNLDGITFFREVLFNDSRMCGEDIYGNFVSFNASNNLVCFYKFAHVYTTIM
jgi:hypothetical protein